MLKLRQMIKQKRKLKERIETKLNKAKKTKDFVTFFNADLEHICFLKVNNTNTRTRCEICSKLTIKTAERCQWRFSGIFIVNF